jgi:hypothetical protein
MASRSWAATSGVAFTGRIDLFSVSRIQRTLLKDLGQQP